MPAWVPIAISLGSALLGAGKKKQPTQFAQFQPYQPTQNTGFDEEEYRRRLFAARQLLDRNPGGLP